MSESVYVIFGATGGIGAELCRRLAARGSRLVVVGRDADRLQGLASEVGAMAHVADVSQFEAADEAVAVAARQFGKVDGVANCVGSLLLKPAHLTTAAEWQQTITANLTTAMAAVRAGAKAIPGTGSIVLVSSAAGRVGLANHEAIAAAKAGVIGLTLSAAATYAPRGLRINCVAPGLVRTPMTTRLTQNEASLKASTAMHALGRIGEPADVASAIDWLLGPESSWITGQVLGTDGGLGSVRPR